MRGRPSTRSLADSLDLELNALALLQTADDLEEVAHLRVAVRPGHAHQTLRRLVRSPGAFLESDSRIDVVAQYCLPGIRVAGEQTRRTLLQTYLANCRNAFHLRTYGFFEVTRVELLLNPPFVFDACNRTEGSGWLPRPAAAGSVWPRPEERSAPETYQETAFTTVPEPVPPEAAGELVKRELDVQPTLRVRPGWPLAVLVHRDLLFRPWQNQPET